MKNVKLFLSTIVAFLMIGISTVNAQQKQSVIVTEILYTNLTIEVIKPDYTVDKQEYSKKEENASIILKKELDKWMGQGFEIKSSTSSAGDPVLYRVSYVLVKEQ